MAWENPLYERFLRRLSSFARVVVIDRRGTGVSDRYSPRDLPPLEDLVDDLAAVLDKLGSSGPCSASPMRGPSARCSRPPVRALGPDPVRDRGKVAGRRPTTPGSGPRRMAGLPRTVRAGGEPASTPNRRSPSSARVWPGEREHGRLVGAVPAALGESERALCTGAGLPGAGHSPDVAGDQRSDLGPAPRRIWSSRLERAATWRARSPAPSTSSSRCRPLPLGGRPERADQGGRALLQHGRTGRAGDVRPHPRDDHVHRHRRFDDTGRGDGRPSMARHASSSRPR